MLNNLQLGEIAMQRLFFIFILFFLNSLYSQDPLPDSDDATGEVKTTTIAEKSKCCYLAPSYPVFHATVLQLLMVHINRKGGIKVEVDIGSGESDSMLPEEFVGYISQIGEIVGGHLVEHAKLCRSHAQLQRELQALKAEIAEVERKKSEACSQARVLGLSPRSDTCALDEDFVVIDEYR